MRSDLSHWTLPVTLALALLMTPFGRAVHVLLPQSTTGYYASVLVVEVVLWGLPALALRKRPRVKKGDAAALGAAALAIGVCLQAAVASVLTMTGVTEAGTVPLPGNAAEWALAVPALVIAPAVCEEAFFRGALLAGLRDRLGAGWALVLSTAVFALLHGSAAGLPGQALVGLLAGLLMLTGGRLGVSMLLHLGYNGAALALAWCPRMDALALLGLVPAAALVVLVRRMPRDTGRIGARDGLLLGAILAAIIGRHYL